MTTLTPKPAEPAPGPACPLPGGRPGRFKRLVVSVTGPWTRKNARDWLALLVLVLLIRWLIFEPFYIPSGSMEPLFHGAARGGDHVGVNKLLYGPRLPFTQKRLFRFAEPKRWDVVVFRNPDPASRHKRLIKRIVGLPGERIQISEGRIWVNGEPVDPPEALRPYLHYTRELELDDDDLRRSILYLARETAPDGLLPPEHPAAQRLNGELAAVAGALGRKDPEKLDSTELVSLTAVLSPETFAIAAEFVKQHQARRYPLRYGILDDPEYSVAPGGCYLVCGDNSAHSVDGRYFGWVPNGHLLGRAYCIWWPLSRWRDLTGFSKTLWGRALLYGIPALVVAGEAWASVRHRRKRRARTAPAPPGPTA